MAETVTVWRHVLRSKHGWGVVLMDSTGIFSAVSAWGTFGHWWSHHGHKDFREFFLEEDWARWPDYAARKFRPQRVYDKKKTFLNIRRQILEDRREACLSKAEARREWDHFVDVVCGQHLVDWKHVDSISEEDFRTWFEGTSLSDAAECAHYGDDPQAVAFVRTILPLLAEELRWDLEAEACARGEVAHG